MGATVHVFRLSNGRGYSVVKGTGRGGSRVTVVGVYATREEAEAAAKRARGKGGTGVTFR